MNAPRSGCPINLTLEALPGSHPLAQRDVVHWTDLRGERFLLPLQHSMSP